jgi:hypothetical protein
MKWYLRAYLIKEAFYKIKIHTFLRSKRHAKICAKRVLSEEFSLRKTKYAFMEIGLTCF